MSMANEQVFHEGDHALYRVGSEDVEVEVIEERGPLGVRGARLVRIRLPLADTDPVELTVSEDDLRAASPAA
jgi:hypothetical protein